MLTLAWTLLPAVVGIAVLSLAALSQLFIRRVPNVLTLPAILAAWSFAAYLDATHTTKGPGLTLVSSLLGTFLVLAIMVPIYRTGGFGAGCIKAQMAFAAWTCCALPLVPALVFVACATIAGLLFTFALAYLRLSAAATPEEQRLRSLFPAQITMAVVGAIGAIASWVISNPV